MPKTYIFVNFGQILNMRKIREIYACRAVRPQAYVLLANFSEMADLSGKRYAYS